MFRLWRPTASLRWRLLLATSAWVLLSLCVVGGVVLYVFKEQTEAQLRNELNVHLNQLSGLLEWQAAQDAAGTPQVLITGRLSEPRFEQPLSGWYWQVGWVEDGGLKVALQSDSLWDEQLPVLPQQETQQWATQVAAFEDEALYLLQQKLQLADDDAPELWLTVGVQDEVIQGPISRFARLLLIALGLTALSLIMAAAVQFHAVMSPLKRLINQLRGIEKGQQQRLEGGFPTELQPLTSAFNDVLETNAAVLERARAQAGNLAHAMKTPMSVLANAAAEDNSPLGILVREQMQQAQQQLDVHLARARAVAQVKTIGVRTLVPPVIDSLQRVCARLYADKNLQWSVELHADTFYFTGEEHDLQEIVGNVFDNACKWARQRIRVRTEAVPSPQGRLGWRLICEDDGPGVAAEQLNRLFERGVRGDERAPGSGLGLAIVHDLITVYGGEVQAGRSDWGGLSVAITLG